MTVTFGNATPAGPGLQVQLDTDAPFGTTLVNVPGEQTSFTVSKATNPDWFGIGIAGSNYEQITITVIALFEQFCPSPITIVWQ